MTWLYRSTCITSESLTELYSATRPTSLRARSTSMTCSARSFGSARSSSSRRLSSSGVWPRGRVPASGRLVISPFSTRTMISGLEPSSVHVARPQEEHERRRVDDAQGPVDVHRVGPGLDAQPLRQDDLEDVARPDVLLARLDGPAGNPRGGSSTRTAAARAPSGPCPRPSAARAAAGGRRRRRSGGRPRRRRRPGRARRRGSRSRRPARSSARGRR